RRSQRDRRPRRKREQAWTRLMRHRGPRGRLFEYDESIRAAEPERIDRGAPRMIACGPVATLGVHEEGTRSEVDLRIGIAEVEARRDFSVLQWQRGLHQGGKSRRLFQLPNVAFDRADRAEASPGGFGADRAGQCGDLL